MGSVGEISVGGFMVVMALGRLEGNVTLGLSV
jgi:hypothetical protein